MTNWFETYYGEDYANSVRGMLTPERNTAEVDFILRETNLQAPAFVADIACGEGRHTLGFARHGFFALGLDRNEKYIEAARQVVEQENLNARFLVADMRQAQNGAFDLVTLLFHSFGFFSDKENALLLRTWAKTLKKGGHFVLDIWNRDAILRHFTPESKWQAAENLTVVEQRAFYPLTGRLEIDYGYYYSDGQKKSYNSSFRLYTFPELQALLEQAGLEIKSVYGSLLGEPYSLDSRRLVIFAKK